MALRLVQDAPAAGGLRLVEDAPKPKGSRTSFFREPVSVGGRVGVGGEPVFNSVGATGETRLRLDEEPPAEETPEQARLKRDSAWIDETMRQFTSREGIDALHAEARAAGVPLGRAVRWKRNQLERQAKAGSLQPPETPSLSMADVNEQSTRERAGAIEFADELRGRIGQWPNTGEGEDPELFSALEVIEQYRKQVAPEVPGPRFMRQLFPREMAQQQERDPNGSWSAAGESLLQSIKQTAAGGAQALGERLRYAGNYIPAVRGLLDTPANFLRTEGYEQGAEALARMNELGAQMAPRPTASVYDDPEGWARYFGQQGVASSGLTLAGMGASLVNPALGAATFLGGAGGSEYGRARIEDGASPSEAGVRALTSAATEGIPEMLGGAAMLGRLPLMGLAQSTARGRAAIAIPTEAGTEGLTEKLNIEAERARGKYISPEEESARIKDAVVIGGMLGGGMGTGSAAIESGARSLQGMYEFAGQAADLTRQARARATTDRILGRTTPPQTPQEAQTDAGAGIAEAAIQNALAARPVVSTIQQNPNTSIPTRIENANSFTSPVAQSDVRENDELDRLLVGALGGAEDGRLANVDAGGVDRLGGAEGARGGPGVDQAAVAENAGEGAFSRDGGSVRNLPDGTYFIPGDPAAIRQRLADAGVEWRGMERTIDGQTGVRFGANTRGQVLGVLGGKSDEQGGITGAQMLDAADMPAASRRDSDQLVNANGRAGGGVGAGGQYSPSLRVANDFDGLAGQSQVTRGQSPVDTTQPTQAEAAVDVAPPKPRNYRDTQFDERKHDLLDFIAMNGGLDRAAAESEGVDPAVWKAKSAENDRFFGKPAFKKGGMSIETLREKLAQSNFAPIAQNRDALDLVFDALGGREVVTPDGATWRQQQRERDENERIQRALSGLPASMRSAAEQAQMQSAIPDGDVESLALAQQAERDLVRDDILSALPSVQDQSPAQRVSAQSLGADYTDRLLSLMGARKSGAMTEAEREEYTALLEQDRETGKVNGRPMVGVGNKTGYVDALSQGRLRPVQVFTDADQFKLVNDKFGHDVGDEVIRLYGSAMIAEFGQGRVWHRGGDEFLADAETDAEADAAMARVAERMRNIRLEVPLSDGRIAVLEGIGVSYGKGATEKDADEGLKRDKERRKRLGLRADRQDADSRSVDPQPDGAWSQAGRADSRRGDGAQGAAAAAEGVAREDSSMGRDRAGSVASDGRMGLEAGNGTEQVGARGTDGRGSPDGDARSGNANASGRAGSVSAAGDRADGGSRIGAVRTAVSRDLGSKFLRRLESQPWFNLVESLDQLPPDVRKSISGDDIAGFVLPDGRVFIIAENVGDNATGIVLHEVGVHFGMSGLPDFPAMLAQFKRMRPRDGAVARAYESVPKDTPADLIDEEAFAYYVEQNWNAKTPLMTRIKDAIARLLNRLGVPTSMIDDALMRQALDGMVQSAREAADKATRGLVTVRDGKVVYADGGRYSRRVQDGRIRRTVAELTNAADSMRTWRDWYDRHDQTLQDVFGDDAALFQKLLSATSQAASVPANIGLALKAYRQLLSGEPFVGYLPAVIKNLERVAADEALRGQKISEYGNANEGSADAIAVDRHIAMLFFNTKSPNRKQVASAKARIRAIAERLGWQPREVQAALWAYNQTLLGTAPEDVKSYDKLIEAQRARIDALRSSLGRGQDQGAREAGGTVGRDAIPERDSEGSREQVGGKVAKYSRRADGGSVGGVGDPIKSLQADLARAEAKFEPLRKRRIYDGPEWDAVEQEASRIRKELYRLTGDAYGNKPKKRQARPSDAALNAEYPSPEDVPPEVLQFEQSRSALIADATDAQRWARIVDTLRDDRLAAGPVTLYRAVMGSDDIRPGDWVTTDREYAEEHNRRWFDGRGNIVEMEVDGRDVLASPTGNYEEAVFAPRSLSGPVKDSRQAPPSEGLGASGPRYSRRADGGSVSPMTPRARAVSEIVAAMQEHDGDFGLRVIDGDAAVGDKLAPSTVWKNGEPTSRKLRGSSSAEVRRADEKSVEAALESLGIGKKGPNGYYFGKTVALIKGRRVGRGEDAGESIIAEAEVIGVWQKETKGNSDILPNEPDDSRQAPPREGLGASGPRYSRRPDTITVDGVERPTTDSTGKPIHPTEEGLRNFWRWFGESKVVDEQGRPLVVYHGTAADFEAFDKGRANPESDVGGGFYFTNNRADVGSNYAGFGPDLTAKVEMLAERIAQDTDRDYSDPDVIAEARAQFATNEGATVPVYLSMKSPAIIGGNGETRLEYEIVEDEDGDMQDEKGTLVDFIMNLRDVSDQYNDGSVDGVVNSLLEEGDGISMSRVYDIISGDEEFGYYTNDDSVLVSKEIFREALERTGFDGIIDRNANKKFGSERRVGQKMQGMDKGTVHFIAFEPEQAKSALGNSGSFSSTDKRIAYSRRTPRTTEQAAALAKAGMPEDNRTLAQRGKDYIAGQWTNLKSLVSAGDAKQSVFDRFHRMSAIEQELGIPPERSAYISARLAAGLPSIMEGVMMYGAPKWENGVLTVDDQTVGLLDALKPVKDDVNAWLGWMVGRRARALKAQGRENLMTDDDIAALLSLANGRDAEFQDAALKYLRIKNAILDVAEKAGLIDPAGRAVWDSVEYIPFYRQDEAEGDTIGPGTRQGLAGQNSGIRSLKGGKQNLADPLGNIVRNFTRLIDASLKNNAMLEAVDEYGDTFFEKVPMSGTFERVPLSQVKKVLLDRGVPQSVIDQMPQGTLTGLTKLWAIKPPTDDDVVRVMRNGKAEYYRVPDKSLLAALTAFKIPAKHWSLRPFKFFKQLLTIGVTSSPDFMARNFVRDSLSSWVISDDKFRVGWDSVKGVVSPLLDDKAQKEMMFAGGSFIGGQFYSVGSEEATANAIRRALRDKGLKSKDIEAFMGTIARTPLALWDKWQKVGSYMENANRNAIYENAIKAGRSKKEAAYLARDLMDFSMHGNSQFVQFLSDVLPFFNARLQGLYKLYRQGGKRALRKALLMRAGTIAAGTMALMAWNLMMFGDGYDELEEWDKDTYWHIAPGTEFHIRVPKPFELGVLFATIPERVARAITYQVPGGDAGDRPRQTLDSFLTQLGGTLALNPIPQGVMPIVEQWANKSFFTGRPIENMGDEKLLPEARAEWYTSDTAKVVSDVIGNKTGLSPKRIEHLWNGYTGTIGAYLLDTTDALVRQIQGAPERPELAWSELPLFKAFYRGDMVPKNTRYMTDFYELKTKAEQVSGTIKEFEIAGRKEDAAELEAENAWLLGPRIRSNRAKAEFMHENVRKINKARDQLSDIRKQIEGIVAMPGFTDDRKRREIDALAIKRNEIAREITRFLRSQERQSR